MFTPRHSKRKGRQARRHGGSCEGFRMPAADGGAAELWGFDGCCPLARAQFFRYGTNIGNAGKQLSPRVRFQRVTCYKKSTHFDFRVMCLMATLLHLRSHGLGYSKPSTKRM